VAENLVSSVHHNIDRTYKEVMELKSILQENAAKHRLNVDGAVDASNDFEKISDKLEAARVAAIAREREMGEV
jgi:hypothetical protein